MISWKDCIVPYGKRVVPPPAPFPLPRKRIQVKCSTCRKWECRRRFYILEFKHCGDWLPKLEVEKNDG